MFGFQKSRELQKAGQTRRRLRSPLTTRGMARAGPMADLSSPSPYFHITFDSKALLIGAVSTEPKRSPS